MLTRRCITLAAIALAATLPLGAAAQAFPPTRPISLLVGFAPGGAADAAARLIAKKLSENIGQSVVVENKGGAGGNIAHQQAAAGPADGTLLLLGSVGPLTIAPHMGKLPYDPFKDLAPVSGAVFFPNLLVVHPSSGIRNMQDFVAAAKKAPNSVSYASTGRGSASHLAGELFAARTGTEMLHVPYKGGAPAINDTLAGNVDMLFAVLPEALPHIQSGKLHALGLMGPQRSKVLAGTPTMAESGFANLNLSAWVGLFAPAKTPQSVIAQLNRAVHKVLQGEVVAKLGDSGMEVAPGTPEQLKQTVHQDLLLHAELVKAAGLVPQ